MTEHPGAPATASPRPAPDPVTNILPYLVAGDGSWQSAHAIREHRCGAVDPAVPLTLAKQRPLFLRRRSPDLCHVPRRPRARDHDWERARAGARRRAHPVARQTRSTLLVLEPERRLFGLSGSRTRVGSQAALIALMVVAFLAADRRRARRRRRPRIAGAGASDLGTRGRVADAAEPPPSPVASPTGVRRSVRDHPSADAEADGRTPTARATR